MKASFWNERWEKQQIGFHSEDVNPLLVKYWPHIKVKPNARVLVPLCGKSLDMCYFNEMGHSVLGCELSELAVTQFFSEYGKPDAAPKRTQIGLHQHVELEGVKIIQGDMLALTPQDCGHIDAFYDRAALIAWPETLRLAYVEKLMMLLPAGSQGLLITLDYPQEVMSGPPFSVQNDWIMANMASGFVIERLSCEDVLQDNPKFIRKQVPWLTESVYRLVRQ
ncbi:thiopurine S-methyltransferase [Shewanella surugensis]|uniref:Thiopurine S-methyltransferase n=1 Tax=Shewanella surugensis TaxID=212020 RepID=A0ABT0LA48_9GAMM|nr:thiopurine S-methyltransferase [Shewanella surugensis]MCL1124568.1 thiopurine S-methyltransferase [Shewanella surugensis]